MLAEALAENPMVQAVHVEPRPDLFLKWVTRRPFGPGGREAGDGLRGFPPLDLPCDPDFDFYGQKTKNPDELPLLVRVHLCPDRVEAGARDLRAMAAETATEYVSRVAVVLEDRARARAAITPGNQVFGAFPGTMGGVLSDGDSLFGLTCAHVTQACPDVLDAPGNTIGKVQAVSTLTPSASHILCKPKSQDGNDMDAALFALDRTFAPGPSGLCVSAAYGSGQRALMRGGKSGGAHSYYFGSIGLTQIVDITAEDGTSRPHCFHLLRSIRPVPGFWSWACRGHQALQGDSGAFITNVSGDLWHGMLCAVDGTEGFFLDAEQVLAWAQGATGCQHLKPY